MASLNVDPMLQPREPVRLSRERWEMLAAKVPYGDPNIISAGFRNIGEAFILLTAPLESKGIIFLPAEYVPADASA